MEEIKQAKDIGTVTNQLYIDGTLISTCRITFGNEIWNISLWETEPNYRHLGYGKQILKYSLQNLFEQGESVNDIRYMWNVQNDYVKEWLVNNFDPIIVLDDAEVEILKLNKDLVFAYFSIK